MYLIDFPSQKSFLLIAFFLPYQYLLHSILNNKEEEEEEEEKQQR